MRFYGFLADPELGGDLLVRHSLDHPLDNLPLSLSQGLCGVRDGPLQVVHPLEQVFQGLRQHPALGPKLPSMGGAYSLDEVCTREGLR